VTGLLPRRVLPVLMYHRVGRGSGDPALWISRQAFRAQLGWIASRGLRTLSLDEAFAAWTAKGAPPRRVVLLTFDDAFAETVEAVLPELAARQMRAAVFAPAGLLGRAVRWQHPVLGAESASGGGIADEALLRCWSEAGHGVGSHGLTHSDLCDRPADEVIHELVESKMRLEALLGRPVPDFCYPFARHDEEARSLVEEAGYRAAYAGEPPRRDRFAIPRMMVYPHDGEARFVRKLSGFYYWLAAWHRRLGRKRRSPR